MSGERLSSLGRRAFTRQETQALTSTFLLLVQRNLITLHLSIHSLPVFSLCLSYLLYTSDEIISHDTFWPLYAFKCKEGNTCVTKTLLKILLTPQIIKPIFFSLTLHTFSRTDP